MSYTAPSGNAVNFQQLGVAAEIPAANAVDFNLFSGNLSQGFKATRFGVASTPLPATGFLVTNFGQAQNKPNARGWITTTFGTADIAGVEQAVGWKSAAFGQAKLATVALGFQSTRFGTIILHRQYPNVAVGGPLATFGTASGWSHRDAVSIGKVTKFSFWTAHTPTHQTVFPIGTKRTTFGYPNVKALTIRSNTFTHATGFKASCFGKVTVFSPVAGESVGANFSPSFGQARAGITLDATGVCLTQFSFPNGVVRVSTSGFKSTAFGQVSAKLTASPKSLYKSTRWGMPRSTLENSYHAYPINAQRKFGTPYSFVRHNYAASGFAAPVQIPTHSAKETHHVTMMIPSVRFGTALLMRNQVC